MTTDFILNHPELLKVERGQNRAQKLLQYIGNVMVNGPCTPLATGLKPAKDAPEAPEVSIQKLAAALPLGSDSSRECHNAPAILPTSEWWTSTTGD